MQQFYLIDKERFIQIESDIASIKEILSSSLSHKGKGQKPDWLTSQQVCELLHISPRRLQTMRDSKEIGFSQAGKKIYYKRIDIEQYLDDHYIEKK